MKIPKKSAAKAASKTLSHQPSSPTPAKSVGLTPVAVNSLAPAILFQNTELIVVNKPSGLLSHSDGSGQANLLDSLQKLSARPLHVLNRLDKEASGLVVLVEMARVEHFQALWQLPTTQKIYTAITHGVCKNQKMKWTWPLSDKAEGRKNPQGLLAQRKDCTTQVEVLESTQYFSLLRIQLATGRQHQIRKHAALNKTPLAGDSRYGDPKKIEIIKKHYSFDRLALHCSEIELSAELKFSCPAPDEFKQLLTGAT